MNRTERTNPTILQILPAMAMPRPFCPVRFTSLSPNIPKMKPKMENIGLKINKRGTLTTDKIPRTREVIALPFVVIG